MIYFNAMFIMYEWFVLPYDVDYLSHFMYAFCMHARMKHDLPAPIHISLCQGATKAGIYLSLILIMHYWHKVKYSIDTI